MKRNKQNALAQAGWEVLEERRLMSAVSFANDTLTLKGDANSDNTFYIRAAEDHGVFAMANGSGLVQSAADINKIVVDLGNKTDTVYVSPIEPMAVEVVAADGSIHMMKPGSSETFNPVQSSKPAAKPAAKSTAVVASTPIIVKAVTPPTSTTATPPSSSSSSTGSTATGNTNTPGNTTSSGVQAVITVTSSTDVYPLESVNVRATNSSFGANTDSTITDTIQWNFGDPTSQYNQLDGFNAAHVYANAGTYTITLTITNVDGEVSTATQQVTVKTDNRPTIYVSSSGNDANDGSSAADPIQTVTRLMQLIKSDTRVLFQSGDTFDLANTNTLTVAGLHDVYFGAYGAGAAPTLMYTGPAGINGSLIGMDKYTLGFTVQGLAFNSIYNDDGDAYAIPSAFFPNGNQITILDNTFLNVLADVNMNSQPDNVLIQGNVSPLTTGLSGYFTFIQGQNIVILGNTVATSAGESLVRGGADGLLVADNNLNNNQKVDITLQIGSYEYVYANQINKGGMGVGPIQSAITNVSIKDVVFEDNIDNGEMVVTPNAEDVMLRNNVFNFNNQSITVDAQVGGAFNWQVQDLYVVHNTVIDTGNYGGFLTVANGVAQDIHVTDNLLVAPNLDTGQGQGIIYVDSNNLDSFSQISDNVWAIPTASNWAQGGYFYLNPHGGVQAGYLTPTEWEATGVPTGDVYDNVTLSSTYSVTVQGFTAGANLPMAA